VPAAIGTLASWPPINRNRRMGRRAVHTVLSIQRAVSQTAGSVPISIRTAIHVTACRTEPGAAGELLHPDDQAEAIAAMDRLAAEIAPDTMLVSQSAVPFVTANWEAFRAGSRWNTPPGSGCVPDIAGPLSTVDRRAAIPRPER
jgi:hypothetical protein